MKSLLRKKQKQIAKPIASKSRLMTTAERMHIQAHLAATELRLSVTNTGSLSRTTTLANLHEYWRKGVFPANSKHTNRRTPVFIDEGGVHCAVGALMEASGNASLARRISKENNYVLAEDLSDADTALWLNEAGITRKEAALIQPGYGFVLVQVSASPSDKVKAALTILVMALIIILTSGLLWLLFKRPRPASYKKKVARGASAVLLLGLSLIFLPRPTVAFNLFTNNGYVGKTIYCRTVSGAAMKDIMNEDPKLDTICKNYDFKDPSKTPGWISGCGVLPEEVPEDVSTRLASVCDSPVL